METVKLVCVDWISVEREKYIWENLYVHSWDEIIGRMYLLKAHSAIEKHAYEDALLAFEQALILLAKPDVDREYYYRALADKALVLCFLKQYTTALTLLTEARANLDAFYQDILIMNQAAVLVLTGAFSEALTLLEQEAPKYPDNDGMRFTMATCLLHLKRYAEAITAYEQVEKQGYFRGKSGLEAARQHRQPNWDSV
jgi:tetratricopeptide (TPR) repeat protein